MTHRFGIAPTCGIHARIRTLATGARLTVRVLCVQITRIPKGPGPTIGTNVALISCEKDVDKKMGEERRAHRSGGLMRPPHMRDVERHSRQC